MTPSPEHRIGGAALSTWRAQKFMELEHLQNSVTQSHSVQDLSRELDWLLREVTGVDRLQFKLELVESCEALSSIYSLDQLEAAWQRRIQAGVPLQYLLGYTTWRNFALKVTPDVLIPRPETEQLIEIVAETTRLRSGAWVDLGTGSGAIAIGLADLLPQAQIHAVDVSSAALAIAGTNAKALGFADRIQFWQGSWFEPLPHHASEIHGICSNPPYIPTELISTLQPEVQGHEPHLALDGGEDGLKSIRHLVTQAQKYLCSKGMLLIECMAGQGNAIASLMAASNYGQVTIHNDLAGFDRFVQGFKSQ